MRSDIYRTVRGRKDRDRGAAMVEFALVLPLFLALVFGIISFGYMLSYRQAVSQSAAEGARALAIAPANMPTEARMSKAINAIDDSLGSYGITCTGGNLIRKGTSVGSCAVEVNIACPSDSSSRCAKVTLTHRYRDNPLIPSFPGLSYSLPEKLTYSAVVEVSS